MKHKLILNIKDIISVKNNEQPDDDLPPLCSATEEHSQGILGGAV